MYLSVYYKRQQKLQYLLKNFYLIFSSFEKYKKTQMSQILTYGKEQYKI